MNVSALSQFGRPAEVRGLPLAEAQTDGSFHSLLRAAGATSLSGEKPNDDKGREAAEQLVATTLVVPILAQLRETSRAAGPFAPSTAEKRFGPLFDQALSDRIVKGANFPLVDHLQRHLRTAQAEPIADSEESKGSSHAGD